jgi:hypothetical protein
MVRVVGMELPAQPDLHPELIHIVRLDQQRSHQGRQLGRLNCGLEDGIAAAKPACQRGHLDNIPSWNITSA